MSCEDADAITCENGSDCLDGAAKVWIKVRNDSKLVVCLQADNDTYGQTVRFLTNPGTASQTVEVWDRSEITPGPKEPVPVLNSPNDYELQVFLAFLGEEETTVRVKAKIVRPDCQVHGGSPYCHQLSGKNGDLAGCVISIFTLPE